MQQIQIQIFYKQFYLNKELLIEILLQLSQQANMKFDHY